jgi:rRNA-processing protein FCF1
LVKVICDTNFLIHLATKRIKNITTLETEIGSIQFVIPTSVISELNKLKNDPQKTDIVSISLKYSKRLPIVEINGDFADDAILQYVKKNGGIVATLDKELKNKIKNSGGSIMSLNNDRIVLEY